MRGVFYIRMYIEFEMGLGWRKTNWTVQQLSRYVQWNSPFWRK